MNTKCFHLFNLRQFINGFLFRDCIFVVVHELCERVMLKSLLFFLSSFGSGSPPLTPAPKPPSAWIKKPCALQSGVHFVRFQLAPNVSPFLLFFCNRTLLFRIYKAVSIFTDRRPDSGSEWQEYYEVEVFGGKQFV